MAYEPIVGVLLAGGLARRMGGGDKPLKTLGGRPILDQVIERSSSQVDTLILNANGEHDRFKDYGLEIVADVIEGYAGPLAGVLTGMEWARSHIPKARWLVSFACDAPFFPTDMVSRLIAEQEKSGTQMACAHSNGRSHPVFALWPVSLVDDLRMAMVEENIRKIDLWTSRYNNVQVEFDNVRENVDPFFNINRPDDLAEAEKLIKNQTV
ncbi:MAG: molybdenum cofactor guanylyltransferase MobA [Rhodospirillales bacterium]|jgi:molybdenum cofactor guanylyltransferase|nr:molybdenum cofactor guanylyltransferase MobA [Rhodospirillales bacterium]